MNSRIQIYTDETMCNRNTFKIYVVIWGQPIYCLLYKEEIERIIDNNRTILGRDFKGFHAHRLNVKNWSSFGRVYLKVLEKVSDYLYSEKLRMLISLESREKYDANAGFLKEQIRKLLEDREGDIGKIFKSLKDRDLPALYHRIDQLIVYYKYKDKMGDDGSIFEFFPDSSGKILSYEDKKFRVSGNLPFEYPLNFYELVRILGDVIARTLLPPDWSVKHQKLANFQPLKWFNDYIIQTCDIVSNFYYNFLRYRVGINESKCRLKSDALLKFLPFDEHLPEIRKNFATNDGEVVCINKELKVNIPIIKV